MISVLQVFYMMLADYFTWLDASEENLTRGTQALLDLCEAFEAIDWDNLGLAEDYGHRGHDVQRERRFDQLDEPERVQLCRR